MKKPIMSNTRKSRLGFMRANETGFTLQAEDASEKFSYSDTRLQRIFSHASSPLQGIRQGIEKNVKNL